MHDLFLTLFTIQSINMDSYESFIHFYIVIGNVKGRSDFPSMRKASLISGSLREIFAAEDEQLQKPFKLKMVWEKVGEGISVVPLLHPGNKKGENAGGKGNGQAEGNGLAQDLPFSPLGAA